MTRDLCASLTWALLSLGAGDSKGLKLAPLSMGRSQESPLFMGKSLCALGLQQSSVGRAAVSAQMGTNTQWAAEIELHTSPSALEVGTQHRGQKKTGCC